MIDELTLFVAPVAPVAPVAATKSTMLRYCYPADWRAFLADETGATAVEYAAMVALIAASVVGSVAALSSAAAGLFDDSADGLQ